MNLHYDCLKIILAFGLETAHQTKLGQSCFQIIIRTKWNTYLSWCYSCTIKRACFDYLTILNLLQGKKRNNIRTHTDFVTDLRSFLQHVFNNWKCELSPSGFSQSPVRTVQRRRPLPQHPVTKSPPSYFISLFLSFPCLTAHNEEYAFNERSPSSVPKALFTFTNLVSSLNLSLLTLTSV